LQAADSVQHSVACWLDTLERHPALGMASEIQRYRLDGHEELVRIDVDMYQALDGTVFHRARPSGARTATA
jgi:hypothetical protein